MRILPVSLRISYAPVCHLIVTCVGLVALLSAISCTCNPNKETDNLSGETLGNLTMELKPTTLVGDDKLTEAIFSLDGPDKALLENFIIKATYTNGIGELEYMTYAGDGSSSAKKSKVVEEKLINLIASSELEPGEEPIKVSFTLVPDETCTVATIQFELLDKKGELIKDNIKTVSWELGAKAIELFLTPTADINLQGITTTELKIKNNGTQSTELGKLKLKIKRLEGKDAKIAEAKMIDADNAEIDWDIVAGGGEVFKMINIVPGNDAKAKFGCWLEYEGNKVGGQSVNINWEAIGKPIELSLTPTEDIVLQGDTKTEVRIDNKSSHPTEAGKLKLKIKRLPGVQAKIDGAVEIDAEQAEITLGIIPAGGFTKQAIHIISDKAANARFTIQMSYEGKDVPGSSVIVDWKRGIAVELKDITYHKDTRRVTYTIENNGSEAIEEVQLKYTNQTEGIKVGSDKLDEAGTQKFMHIIKKLLPGQKLESQDLGELDFGDNKEANLVFSLLYQGGSILPKSYTFMPAGINLGLKLIYIPEDGQVGYELENTGLDIAKNVKIKYEAKAPIGATLDGQQQGEVGLVDLNAKNGVTTGVWRIDFGNKDEAVFEFSVICNGVVMSQLTREETFKAPKVDLELKLESSPNLAREEREIKLKIEPKSGSLPLEKINLTDLELIIQSNNHSENKNNSDIGELFSKDPEGKEQVGTALKFKDINALKDSILLYLNVKEATRPQDNYRFVLKYKGNQQAVVDVTWKLSSDLKIESPDKDFAEMALFNLISANYEDIDLKNLSVELEPQGNSKAEFAFLDTKSQQIGTVAPVSSLIMNTRMRLRSDYARLVLVDPKGEKSGNIKILLKRDNYLINSLVIPWREPKFSIGINIRYTNDERVFNDDDPVSIGLQNYGDAIDRDKIKLQLNGKGFSFQLEELTGANIDENLATVLNESNNKFHKGDKLFVSLQRDITKPLPSEYSIPVTFKLTTLSDRGKNEDNEEELTWINTEKIKQEIEIPFEKSLTDLRKSLGAIKTKITGQKSALNNEEIQKIYQVSVQVVALQQKAKKKLEDEKAILPDWLQNRIQTKTVDPTQDFLEEIDRYHEKFLASAKQEMQRLLKESKDANVQQMLTKVSLNKSFGGLKSLTESIKGLFIDNNKRYKEAEQWIKSMHEYNSAANAVGITQSEKIQQTFKEIEALMDSLEANLQANYEEAAKVYEEQFKKGSEAVNSNNIDENFADNTLTIFGLFYHVINSYPVSSIKLTTAEKVAQNFQHVIKALSDAIQASKYASVSLNSKKAYVYKIEELVNSDLFKKLEETVPNKKEDTALTQAIKTILEAAKKALETIKFHVGQSGQDGIVAAIKQIDERLKEY